MFVEGVFSRETTEHSSRGVYSNLLIFSPTSIRDQGDIQLPSGRVSHNNGAYHFSWTTWWAVEEVQSEIVRLSGGIRLGNGDRRGRIGRLDEADVFYGQLRGRPPRVAVIGEQFPTRSASELFIATAVGNKGIGLSELIQLIDEFAVRRNVYIK